MTPPEATLILLVLLINATSYAHLRYKLHSEIARTYKSMAHVAELVERETRDLEDRQHIIAQYAIAAALETTPEPP